jgi:hypothetical protein
LAEITPKTPALLALAVVFDPPLHIGTNHNDIGGDGHLIALSLLESISSGVCLQSER